MQPKPGWCGPAGSAWDLGSVGNQFIRRKERRKAASMAAASCGCRKLKIHYHTIAGPTDLSSSLHVVRVL